MPRKLLIEEHFCRFCKKNFRIIIYDKNNQLNQDDIDQLGLNGIWAIKKGADIRCPNCKEKLCTA
jgi:hypothetical protein